MSFRGTADFSIGASSLYTVKLVRTVAKLRFNITTASNVTITKMSLQNAPKQTKLFPHANPGYNFAERAIGATGGSFTLYMPEHLAGTVPSITDQTQRTRERAPANATYLLIEGEVLSPVSGTDGYTVSRKKFESIVYLGSNVTNDFNVRRNNDYKIDINITGDLKSDYRIGLSRVGYNADKHLTSDGKYLWYERIRFTLFYNTGEKGYGAEKVTYKLLFEGFTPGKMKIDGQYLTGNTVTGTIEAGRGDVIDLWYDDTTFYKPENHLIKYTLTFTDDYGGTTVYPGELRFCNIISVSTRPRKDAVKKADIKFTAPSATIVEYEPASIYDYNVYSVDSSIEMTITPRPGYTFKGWYKSFECLDKDLISSSRTLIHKPDYKHTSVYAKVE
jgi:uncharacterized repeat protein (TIGR02543 family)